jgi:tol-pal system protein YbgF
MRAASLIALVALAGCAAAPRPNTELEAQVRQLRAEQDRQGRQIELLENRVTLAEDSARAARQALLGSRHGTIRIEPDGTTTRDESPQAAPEPIRPLSESSDEDEAPADNTNTPRPVIRATGRDNSPAPLNPITVRDDDRLPVAPVPPPPATDPRGRPPSGGPREEAPGSALPAADATPLAHSAALPATSAPGVSSVRDPRSAPAYDSALALARGGRCNEAVDAFSQFLVRWPDHPFADNAMYWRGECILRNGDVRRAASEFEGLIARFPVGNKVPDALYKLVQCYDRLGDANRSRSFATRLLREFPQSEVAARLRAERNPR